jgi:hypothetical protein
MRKSYLNSAYNNKKNEFIRNNPEEISSRFEFYEYLLEILKKNKLNEFVDEFKYRFSDGENPNNIILSMCYENKNINELLKENISILKTFNEIDNKKQIKL